MLPSQFLENGWCQKFSTLDKDRHPVEFDSPEVMSCCMAAALELSRRTGSISELETIMLRDIIDIKITEMGFISYVHYNDAYERTQKEVVEFMKQCEVAIGLNSE